MMSGLIPSPRSCVLSHDSPVAISYFLSTCYILSILEPARPAFRPVSNPSPSKSPSLSLASLDGEFLSLLQPPLPRNPIPGMTSVF